MQFCDLGAQYRAYKTEIDEAIASVLESSVFVGGPEVESLERELCAFSGAEHAIACANGTDALQAALMALGVRPGDEIIVPDFTFAATAEAVVLAGAVPVFADIDPATFNVAPETVLPRITERTRGVVAVSLFGRIPDLEGLVRLGRPRGIWVLEDGAQSFGASREGRLSGSIADVSTVSFYPSKPLGCYGDGGAVFCRDAALAARVRRVCDHGQSGKYVHEVAGFNSRLDAIQAAVLRVKLRHFERELEARNQVALAYGELLSGVVPVPELADGERSSWAQYTVRVPRRDEIRSRLRERGIPTAVHYPVPLRRQPAFAGFAGLDDSCPESDRAAGEVLSLPMHAFLAQGCIRRTGSAISETLSGIGSGFDPG